MSRSQTNAVILRGELFARRTTYATCAGNYLEGAPS